MGSILFLFALIFELVFTVYCIKTKSFQYRIRNIVRIVAFLGFVLILLLKIIEWNFTFYILAGFLLLLATLGLYNLVRKKEVKKEYKTGRIVRKDIGMTLLIFVVTLPAIILPMYKMLKPTGNYQVATVNYTYIDANRVETYTNTGEKRKLNVEFWYPKDADKTYPLIVFSHGSLGIKESNETLYNELASHGYIVCSIDHTYQCFSTTDDEENTIKIDPGFIKELRACNPKKDKESAYQYFKKWMTIRMGDIDFIIDTICSEAKKPKKEGVYELVDITKIGVMGHSLGGSAALGIGRERDDVSAVISLEAPFMYDITGVKDGKFIFTNEVYPVPVLNVYSDSAWNHLDEWMEYTENYDLLSNTKATAFNVHIKGVGHLSLTDFVLTSPILSDLLSGYISTTSKEHCLRTINKVCLDFFDCYLKGEGEFASDGEY